MKSNDSSKTRVFHYTNKKYGLQAIKNQRLKVAIIDELNDPFELLAPDLSDRNTRRRFLEWKRNISQKYGFICCSNTIHEPLLWSHYADKHRGVVLELYIDSQSIIDVRYRKGRLKLDLAMIEKRGGFSKALALDLGRLKYEKWIYEQECRVPIDLKDCVIEDNKYFEATGSGIDIVGIIAGPLCGITPKEVKENIPQGQEITLSRAKLATRSYRVIQSGKLGSVLIT